MFSYSFLFVSIYVFSTLGTSFSTCDVENAIQHPRIQLTPTPPSSGCDRTGSASSSDRRSPPTAARAFRAECTAPSPCAAHSARPAGRTCQITNQKKNVEPASPQATRTAAPPLTSDCTGTAAPSQCPAASRCAAPPPARTNAGTPANGTGCRCCASETWGTARTPAPPPPPSCAAT